MKGELSLHGSQLMHRHGGETLVVEPWGRDGLRVRATLNHEVDDRNWALTETVAGALGESSSNASIEIADNQAFIANGLISACLTDPSPVPGSGHVLQAGHLQFFRGGEPILGEYDYVVGAHNPGTRTYKPVPGFEEEGLYRTEVHFAPRPDERLYGMGLNATGGVNLKGCVIDLYQRHVKHTVPFLVSSAGYGLLWNNPSLGRVELGRNRTRWVSDGCRQIDYYVTVGDTYGAIMENYADATGHAPEMPYWASGFWQCKLRYRTQEELLATAREFQRRGLPLSVIVIDFRHWRKTGDWKLDPDYWPDPEAMVRELDDMGVRIMISPWVLVEEESENFGPMLAQGLFIDSLDGGETWIPWQANDGQAVRTRQVDPTNPQAAAYLWDKWKRHYFDLGIRTFWLDPCDDLHSIRDYDRVRYHAGPALEAHCHYPVAHQKNIHDALHAAGEHEVVTICRSSWAGSQRYGASPAAHDIKSSFEHLDEYMKAGLNLAMSGIPWGAAEIGGFVTPDSQSEYFRELMVRWYQYGMFTPIFRTHGHRPNNEAWTIGGDSYRFIRAAMLLRERLRPYVMAQMQLASDRGIPPMRPLFFDFEHDLQTHAVEDQFLLGPDLLVAPVTAYRQRRRAVYLPEGELWSCAWTGRQHNGGRTLDIAAPLEHIPVFVRGAEPNVDLALFQV